MQTLCCLVSPVAEQICLCHLHSLINGMLVQVIPWLWYGCGAVSTLCVDKGQAGRCNPCEQVVLVDAFAMR